MANHKPNDIGSLLLNHASSTTTTTTTTKTTTSSSTFRLWSIFSTASFRRKLLSTFRCGTKTFPHHHHNNNPPLPSPPPPPPPPPQRKPTSGSKSEKLCDLLSIAEAHERQESDAETKKKVEYLEKLKNVVRDLQCEEEEGGRERRKVGACNVRLLSKEDSEARVTLAMLGAIPPLVGMIDDDDDDDNESLDLDSKIAALYALLNLGIGNDTNKAAIVKAGAVHKMLKLIDSPNKAPNPAVSEAVAANFLGLSALDSNKPIIGSSGAIPFLLDTLLDLDHRSSSQAKQDALRALYNLSIFPSNLSYILETDLIPYLVNSLGDMEVSERMLSVLSNVVSSPEGRKAVSGVRDAFPILIDVLNWTDSPGCQEKASYILMVMAHKAYGDRQAMIEAGIVSALLELTLLGSTLAQKRASRILEFLRVDKGKHISVNFGGGNLVATISAPICGPSSTSLSLNGDGKEHLEDEEDMMSEEKKAVKQLVQQSLQNNMKRIVKRANLPQDFVPSDHLKSLTASSTSKSLPF